VNAYYRTYIYLQRMVYTICIHSRQHIGSPDPCRLMPVGPQMADRACRPAEGRQEASTRALCLPLAGAVPPPARGLLFGGCEGNVFFNLDFLFLVTILVSLVNWIS